MRDPVVTVIVTNFVGPYSEQIRVVGEAAKPQFLPYKQKMTVMDVMIAVGGLTEFADGNKATIIRASENNKRYGVRLQDLVKRGDISANVEMLPGDILIIATFAVYNEIELAKYEPDLIYVDSQNRITRRGHKIPVQAAA